MSLHLWKDPQSSETPEVKVQAWAYGRHSHLNPTTQLPRRQVDWNLGRDVSNDSRLALLILIFCQTSLVCRAKVQERALRGGHPNNAVSFLWLLPFRFLANLREDPTMENSRLLSLENGDHCYSDSLTHQIPWASIASSMWWLQILDLGLFCCFSFNHFIPHFLICSQSINWHSINCTWTCNLMDMMYLCTW